jgi:hypothetical protein
MTKFDFVRMLVNDPDHPGELLIDLGEELTNYLGWKPGDAIQWTDNGNGTWSLSKSKHDNNV